MRGDDESGNLFVGHYIEWRDNRIRKMIEVMGGEEWFDDKRILEVGCGWGDIGLHFQGLGSEVVFTDCRKEHTEKVLERCDTATTHVIDQNKEWEIEEKDFDLIVHTGVLYHLYEWKRDLDCSLKHGDTMILETVVADNEEDDVEIMYREPDGWDQSPAKYSKRPTAAYIEKYLTSKGYSFERFDHADLNAHKHVYDWKVSNWHRRHGPWSMPAGKITRRFWKITRDTEQDA